MADQDSIEQPSEDSKDFQDSSELNSLSRLGAAINRLGDNSSLDQIDQEEIERFEKNFPEEYQAGKIDQILTPVQKKLVKLDDQEDPEFGFLEDQKEKSENPSEGGMLADQESHLLDETLKDHSSDLTEEGTAPLIEESQSDEDTSQLDEIEDIPFDVPVVGDLENQSLSAEEETPYEEELAVEDEIDQLEPPVEEDSQEVVRDDESQQEVETKESEVRDADTTTLAEEELAKEVVGTEPSEETEPSGAEPSPEPKNLDLEEKFSLENLVENDQPDETDRLPVSENELINEFIPQEDESFLLQENYEKALILLKKFNPTNKKIIFSAIEKKQLTEAQTEDIFSDILKHKNETRVVEKVSNYLLKQDDFYEVLERRGKILKQEEKIVSQVFKKLDITQQIKQVFFFSLFLLLLGLAAYFGYDHISAYRLYNKATDYITDDDYELGEKYYQLALEKKVHLSRVIQIGDIYLEKEKYLEAKEKYEDGLKYAPGSLKAQIAYGNYFFIRKDFQKAETVFLTARRNRVSEPDLEEALGENYLEWGKNDRSKWGLSHQIYTDLINTNPDSFLLYLAKKLEIYSLQKNYYKAKFLLTTINQEDDTFRPLKPFSTYVGFLIKTYQNKDEKGETILKQSVLETQEDQFIIKNIDHILEKIYRLYPDNPITYYYLSSWKSILKDRREAIKFAKIGAEKARDTKNYYFEGDQILSLHGKLLFEDQEVEQSREYFIESMKRNPNNQIANYYLGKINLIHDKDYGRAEDFFTRALENWGSYDDPEKIDLIYSLGYLNYLKGKEKNLTLEEKEKSFVEAIGYWNQLIDKINSKKDYLIDYCIALSYLQLGKYDLASTFLEIHLKDIEKLFPIYNLSQEKTLPEIKDRLYILSDIYNNLGVVNIHKFLSEDKGQTELLQNGLENLINSISLKDKLGLIKGIPYANFNTINSYPKVTKSETINKSFLENSKFKIADEFVPASIL